MEWSDPFDAAWDGHGDDGVPDPSHGTGDPAYPPAPLPAHERRWRHPSEVGQQAWIASEPPVVIGRGLLATAGVIGSALGLAVLWLVVPLTNSDPSNAPTAMRATNTVVPPGVGTRPVATVPATTTARPHVSFVGSSLPPVLAGVGTSVVATSARPVPAATTPVDAEPSNTVLLRASTSSSPAASIAVRVGGSPLLVTTAAAVGTDSRLDVLLDSGTTASADVVDVGDTLAYLAPRGDSAADLTAAAVGFDTAARAVPGETLYVLSDEPLPFTYDDQADLGEQVGGDVTEGAPVVDESGALVGLCTHRDGAVQLVQLPAPDTDETASTVPESSTTDTAPADATTTDPTSSSAPGTEPSSTSPVTSGGATSSAPATTAAAGGATTTSSLTPTTVPMSARGWLGIRVAQGSPSGAATVGVVEVTAGGPAATAGVVVGDVLWAVDGMQLSTIESLTEVLAHHRPGDTLVLTVLRSTPAPQSPGASTTAAVSGTTTTSPATSTTVPASAPASSSTIQISVVLGERGPSV